MIESPISEATICRHPEVPLPRVRIVKRADLVLIVNGIPLVVIETQTSAGASRSWFDGAHQIHHYDERSVPELFVPNLLSIVTDGEELRYGSVGLPVELWGTWRTEAGGETPAAPARMREESIFRPKSRWIYWLISLRMPPTRQAPHHIVARQHNTDDQSEVERVVAGPPQQTSSATPRVGTSRVMLFAGRKLALHPELKNPTVLMVVDPIELEGSSSVFNTAFTPGFVRADSLAELQRLLAQDTRMVVITTTPTFAEAAGVLCDRTNIVAMVDEAHRAHEDGLGCRIHEALPNAFLFGLSGGAINEQRTFDCAHRPWQ